MGYTKQNFKSGDILTAEQLNKMDTALAEGVVYSTNEHVVGKWVDNKPIYQKTIVLEPNRVIKDEVIYTIENMDTFVNFECVERNSSNAWVTTNYYTNGDDSFRFYMSGNSCKMYSGHTITKMWVTIRYTKTTD